MPNEAVIDLEARVLKLSREFAAPVDQVFDAWAIPENLIQWWGPEGVHIAEHNIDVSEGGAWRTVMQNKDGQQFIVSGIYKVIDRPNCLRFTWAWDQDDGTRGFETEVEILFEETDAGTQMNITHGAFQDEEVTKNHDMGWSSSLNCLEQFIAS